MKILVLSHMYPQPGHEHYGLFVHEANLELMARGHELRVVSPVQTVPTGAGLLSKRWQRLASLPLRRELDGLRIDHPRYLLWPRRIDFAGAARRMARSVLKLPDLAGYDLLHAHTLLPDGGAARRIADKLDLPLVITSHGSDVVRASDWSPRAHGEIHDALDRADLFLSPSRVALGRALDRGFPCEKGRVLWNGFDAATFSGGARPGEQREHLHVVTVANLIPQKQVDVLIKALARVADRGTACQLHVIGNGPMQSELRSLAQELGLPVRWSPALGRTALAAALREAQVFALPSFDEAFGIVYLEAMAQGLPVLGLKNEGVSEIITDGKEGFLLPRDDMGALIDRLETLATDARLRERMGTAARELATDKDWRHYAAELDTLFQGILHRGKPPGAAPVLHLLYNSLPDLNGYAMRSQAILVGQMRRGLSAQACTSPFQALHWSRGPRESRDGVRFHRLKLRGAQNRRGHLGWRRYPRFLQKALADRLLAGQLALILKRERPQVLHAHSPAFNFFLARRAARKAGMASLPIVYEVRGLTEETEIEVGNVRAGGIFYRLKRRIEERAMQTADRVVTISEGLRDDFAGRGIDAGRVDVMPNGIDPGRITPFDRDDAKAGAMGLSKGRTLGYIGTMGRLEGLPWLVKRLAELPSDWKLLLIGDGQDRAPLLAEAEQRGLASRIIAPGKVDPAEVPFWFSLIDYFVLPRLSLRVTERVTPLKPLEAMCAGTLVLASNVGGHREIIRHGETGFLFDRDEPEEFAQLLKELSADDDRRRKVSAAARSWVVAERSWDSLLAGYDDTYQRAREERK